MMMVLPTAPPAGKRFAATVLPRTATLDTRATSWFVKKLPWATVQLPTVGQSGVVPPITVYQLAEPATTWVLVCE